MSEMIGGYEVKEPLSNKNAGFSKWGFGEKDGKTWFLKEFLSPVYPVNRGEMTEKSMQRKLTQCHEYEIDKIRLFSQLGRASDGNLLWIHEFFRYGSKYYIATEAVTGKTFQDAVQLPEEKKILVLKILAHSMASLHQAGLVHGDIKPDNLIFRETKNGNISAKIIDIDGCFSVSAPPTDPDSMNGDQLYLAPETFQFILEQPVKLTEKIDVFAMGLVFFQLLTGDMPAFPSDDYKYPFSVLLDGKALDLSAVKNETLQEIIAGMLAADPVHRTSMQQVYETLSAAWPVKTARVSTGPVDWTRTASYEDAQRRLRRMGSFPPGAGPVDPRAAAYAGSLGGSGALKGRMGPARSAPGAGAAEDTDEFFSAAGDL